MKVLVTGHLGFIGPHVVDFCKKEGLCGSEIFFD